MSDVGDDAFKSLFDEDLDKAKGRRSAGLSDDSMVKAQHSYAASINYIKTLVDNTSRYRVFYHDSDFIVNLFIDYVILNLKYLATSI